MAFAGKIAHTHNNRTKNLTFTESSTYMKHRVATDSTSWDYPACTRNTLWRQHYVRTSKEYL